MENNIKNERLGLEHVYWIGGCPSGGKTTFTTHLREKYHFSSYHTDKQAGQIYEKAKTGPYPNFLKMAETDFDRLLMLPDEEWLELSILSMREIFNVFVSDLQKMLSGNSIVAEGAELLPELLNEICEPTRALFAIPSHEFLCENLPKQKWVVNILNHLHGHDYKQQFVENLKNKYDVFRVYLSESAEELNMKIITAENKYDLGENLANVCDHFSLE